MRDKGGAVHDQLSNTNQVINPYGENCTLLGYPMVVRRPEHDAKAKEFMEKVKSVGRWNPPPRTRSPTPSTLGRAPGPTTTGRPSSSRTHRLLKVKVAVPGFDSQ